MIYNREIDFDRYRSSQLILGPRMTGKSYLLAQKGAAFLVDLLLPDVELKYKSHPEIFYQEVRDIQAGETIIIDEIQRVPKLLDYVQVGIERHGHRYLLSGSSARKLKRGAANLLAGRAILTRIFPLSLSEVGNTLSVQDMIYFGTLPKVASLIAEDQLDEAKAVLNTYAQVYLKEEIQEEAIVRHIGSFNRFLSVAAQFVGQSVVYSNIASSSAVPRSTVAEYFSILEDTLIGNRLWEHQKSEKDKSKPKFYLFDNGVVRAMNRRLNDSPTPAELGPLFENFIFNEITKRLAYDQKAHTLSYWKGRKEIDFLIEKNGEVVLAIECKSGKTNAEKFDYADFHKRFPKVTILVASLQDSKARRVSDQVLVLPWHEALASID